MIPAMQQQGASKAARKQLIWVSQHSTCYITHTKRQPKAEVPDRVGRGLGVKVAWDWDKR